ncbi:MAG: triose-phosphate isomerase [Chlamydiales bacterium]|nr:triose-phosphate isomerase [Chlamydiales bacterium]
MAKQARQCLLVGNWKMYKTIDQAVAFIDEITPMAEKSTSKIMLAVPFTAIKTLADKVTGTSIVIGAQNMNDASQGAFTGEIAASMLKDAGAQFVLLGHSERRTIFHENNAFINRKVLRALESELAPLLCIGESYEDHEQSKTHDVLKEQLTECLKDCKPEALQSLIVAYEPVWAIGTGLAATLEVVEAAMKGIRDVLTELLGAKAAKGISILYGGSVSAQNADNYLNSSEIDGLLIGSASLSTESFAKIISLRQNT